MQTNLPSVLVIGASIADITGKSENPLFSGDSNPGKIYISAGGVARNIAENLARLNVPVHLISAFANDFFGKTIIEQTLLAGVNIDHCIVDANHRTATYMAINNHNGSLEVAISDTSIIELITPDFIKSKHDEIEKHDVVVLDTNLPVETIEFITNTYSHKSIFVDLVSKTKAIKIKNCLNQIFTIKPNVAEVEILSEFTFSQNADLLLIKEILLQKGLKQAFITLGNQGCFYFNQFESGEIKAAKINPVNVSGAGDAFMAGLVYSYIAKKSIHQSAKFAMAASVIALNSEKAVNHEISVDLIHHTMNEYFG